MALEHVSDYPRPPALVPCADHVVVRVLGQLLCDTHHSLRVLETFHPPTYYLPPETMALSLLRPARPCRVPCGNTPSPRLRLRRWPVGMPSTRPRWMVVG